MKVYTVDDIVEHTRLRKNTVLKLLRTGELPGRKVGGQWRTTRELVDEWQKDFYRGGKDDG